MQANPKESDIRSQSGKEVTRNMSKIYIRGSPQRSSTKASQKHGTEGDHKMTFEQLFKKLRRSGLNCAVAENRLTELRNGEYKKDNFEFLNGFLRGLETAKLISSEEWDELYGIINNLW